MAIQAGDFTISLSISGLSGNIESVLGKEVMLSIIFNNNSLTDSLYNLGLNLELPDGISFISSSIPETTSTIDASFKNIVEFINIKDLYQNETGYTVDIILKSEEYYRASPSTQVDFGEVIAGLNFSASADTKPRGSLDAGNSNITTLQTSSFEVFRYSVSFIGPTTFLKGAGELSGPPLAAESKFDYEFKLSNNTLESSVIDVDINLANGIRYIGEFSSIGTDSSEFISPTVLIPGISGINNSVVSFSDKTLSAGSDTTLAFKGAIWNNLTTGGIENSGSEILQGDLLQSSVELSSSLYASAFAYSSMSALILFITKTLASAITDWNVINNFTIGYTATSYFGINAINLTNIIPDGMTFLSANPVPTSMQVNPNGTTDINWNIGDITSSGTGTITFSTTTNESYLNLDPIYSTDTFISTLNATFDHPVLGNTLIDSIDKSLSVPAPVISKEITNYYYSDLTQKPFNVATVEDFVKFKIIYDASSILAPQKNAMLYDYPPLNMIMSSVPTYTTTGDFPLGVIPELVDDNGILLDLSNLSGGDYFEVDYTIEVTDITNSSELNNLAKLNITDINNNSTSIRDSAVIYFGDPNLKLTQTLTGQDCASFNTNYYYTLKVKNKSNANNQNISEIFNLILTIDIPDIFTITNIDITGNGTYTTPVTVGDITTVAVQNLPIEEILTFDIDLRVSTPPLMSNTYTITSDITGGTAQEDPTSTEYIANAKSLTQKIIACTPSITKTFSSSTSNLGELYTVTSVIEIPSGILAYNVNISDTLITDNNNNFSNLTLNDISESYTLTNTDLTVPIATTLNTSSGQKIYTLVYENSLDTITPTDNEETRSSESYLNWTDSLGGNSNSINNSASLTIFEPELTVEKFQRNYTQSTDFTKNALKAKLGDIILYKLRISNTGKAPAYDILIQDVLDTDLDFINILVGSGSFNSTTNTITLNHETLNNDYYIEVLITSSVNNISSNLIAINDTETTYKANSTLGIYNTVSSNETHLLNEIFKLKKAQRNVTLGTDFSIATLPVINGQTFQYKVKIKNLDSSILTNVQISDTFPEGIEFVSFEPFSNGTVSRNGYDITIDISSISLNEIVEVIYTLKLTTDTLKVDSSFATSTFEIPSESESFTLESNTIYTRFSSIGRGFKIY